RFGKDDVATQTEIRQIIDAELSSEKFALFADHIATASEGAERVRTIVEDLRMFSRPDSDATRQLDIRQPLRRALSMVRDQLDHADRDVEIVLDDEYHQENITPTVIANEGRLTQVFVNLLVNAAQAIAEASASSASRPRHEVRARVALENHDHDHDHDHDQH